MMNFIYFIINRKCDKNMSLLNCYFYEFIFSSFYITNITGLILIYQRK